MMQNRFEMNVLRRLFLDYFIINTMFVNACHMNLDTKPSRFFPANEKS